MLDRVLWDIFWFFLVCGCCLIWFCFLIWFVRRVCFVKFNFCEVGFFFVKDLFVRVRWLEKDVLVVKCNVVGFVRLEFLVFLGFVLLCLDIFIVCCCIGIVIFNVYDCMFDL